MSIKQSDQILVQSYLSGDEAAFEVLIRKHKDKVFAFILSKLKNYNLAHDVFQDTFITSQCFKHLHTTPFDSFQEFQYCGFIRR